MHGRIEPEPVQARDQGEGANDQSDNEQQQHEAEQADAFLSGLLAAGPPANGQAEQQRDQQPGKEEGCCEIPHGFDPSRLLDCKFDATILLLVGRCIVGCDGFGVTVTNGLQVGAGDAFAHQILNHGLGTTLREILVVDR